MSCYKNVMYKKTCISLLLLSTFTSFITAMQNNKSHHFLIISSSYWQQDKFLEDWSALLQALRRKVAGKGHYRKPNIHTQKHKTLKKKEQRMIHQGEQHITPPNTPIPTDEQPEIRIGFFNCDVIFSQLMGFIPLSQILSKKTKIDDIQLKELYLAQKLAKNIFDITKNTDAHLHIITCGSESNKLVGLASQLLNNDRTTFTSHSSLQCSEYVKQLSNVFTLARHCLMTDLLEKYQSLEKPPMHCITSIHTIINEQPTPTTYLFAYDDYSTKHVFYYYPEAFLTSHSPSSQHPAERLISLHGLMHSSSEFTHCLSCLCCCCCDDEKTISPEASDEIAQKIIDAAFFAAVH